MSTKIFTKEQMDSMEEAAKPLVKWLNENCNPHVIIIVDSVSAELLRGQMRVQIEEFLRD